MNILSKHLLYSTFVVAVSAFGVGAAVAQSVTSGTDWSGLQVGGHIGVVQAHSEFHTSLTSEDLSFNPTGFSSTAKPMSI